MTAIQEKPSRPIGGFLGLKRVRIAPYEKGLLWRDGKCERTLGQGTHWFFDPLEKIAVTVRDASRADISENELDAILKSGAVANDVETVEVAPHQCCVVHRDGRYAGVLGPGKYGWWKNGPKISARIVDTRDDGGAVDLAAVPSLFTDPAAEPFLQRVEIPVWARAVFFRNGNLEKVLGPGRHAYWRSADLIEFHAVDLREQTRDISGQELLTSDKLPIRMNAILSYRVADPAKSVTVAADLPQTLYREAQLALRARVGEHDLETLLTDKTGLAGDISVDLRDKFSAYGAEVVSFGVRDVILPGDVKALLLKATEARKSSEAATILRREETAAMRQQLNTARLLADNPTLMRLRELETVEKVADSGKLTVVLGDDKGLAGKVSEMM